VGSILARLQKCLGNPHVSVSLDREKGYHEPSKTTSTRSDPYLALSRTIRQTFDHIPVIPGLMIASTDSIHFQSISHHIFRFNPIKINPKADLKRIHGVDERIHVHQYGNAKI
jgi:carboxypeptidase PM20D1